MIEKRLESPGPAWIRWAPPPTVGLPILLGGAALIAYGTVAWNFPRGLFTLLAIPIPFISTRWNRGAVYLAIAGLFSAGILVALRDGEFAFQTIQRAVVQVVALALVTEFIRSATRAQARSADALAESEARYRSLVESSSVIPFEFDLTTMRFTYVGPQAEEILGFPQAVWLGEDFWMDHLHPADRDGAMAHCQAASLRGEDHELDYRMLDAAGEPVWIHDIVSVVSGEGQPTSLRGVMVDITERKLAEQERREFEAHLVETQKLESLGLVAGGVAHDFNNLLTAVLGNASLVLEELPSNHPSRGKIEDLATAAERGSDLTSQMLAYAGRSTLVTQPRDLSELASETARLLASSISKKARLCLELEPAVWVKIDAGQLHQVVMNLVTNASDALGDEEGTIQVRTGIETEGSAGETRQHAFLEVMDDGTGMDEQTLRDMFDPFFTTKFSGRGLGLAAVHGIVRSHGGTIDVDSEPGRGSRVRVRLPSCPAPALESARTASPPSRRSIRSGSATLLVVDDETQVRDVTRMALERGGFKVIEASDGHEALALVDQDPSIDAVVLDMTMPRLSGGETLQALRVDHPKLPVLLISGYAGEPRLALDPDGPSDFLQKPFRPSQVADKIAELLRI